MNDLVYAVEQNRLSYADDTKIYFADSTPEKVEEVINADLANVDKWYEQNGMKRNRLSPSFTAKILLFLSPEISKCSELQSKTN